MHKRLFLLLLILPFQSAFAQQSGDRFKKPGHSRVASNPSDLAKLLMKLPEVSFRAIETPEGFASAYELRIQQPIDHNHPELGTFEQKVFLSHQGFDAPTVMVTEGYSRGRNRVYELTELLGANQLDIEHRFFGDSKPEGMDYQYLNLEQATADLHRINTLLRSIYAGKWVSTGISKGGATSIFYRYFFPEDVDASVPYVAPINREFEEQRIYTFLDTVGSEVCRQKLLDLQLRILKQRDEVLPMVHFYSKGARLAYTYLTPEEAFEYAVLEFPFSFWQWGHRSEDIPAQDAPLTEAVEYLLDVSNVDFFADGSMQRLGAHYYQSATEMGYYGYETEPFEGLLHALPMQPHPHAAFMPDKMPFEFDGSLLEKVNAWLDTEAHQFAYIYGAQDTWSACSVPPNDNVDAVWFMLAGKHHGNARIAHMTPSEKALLIQKLEEWLDVEIPTEPRD